MKMVRLGEVVNFYSGGTPAKSNSKFWTGSVPWFSAKDIKKWRLLDSADHLSEEVFRSTPLKRLPAGTVVLVVRGMILAHTVPISILDVEAAINQDLKALIPIKPLDPSFLAAMLRAQQDKILGQVSTAAHGTKKLDSRILESIEIPLLPITEQRRVAKILDRAHAITVKRRRVLGLIGEIPAAVFYRMFGDGGGLTTVSVGEVSQVQGGLQVTSKREVNPVAVPYLRVANVYRNRLNLSQIKTLRATSSEVERTQLADGDLLFVEGHANPMEVGRVAIWEERLGTYVHQNHLIRARLDQTKVLPTYASIWLNMDAGAAHFRRAGRTTSGLNTISAATVRSAPLPLPSLDAQRAFVGAVGCARSLAKSAAPNVLDELSTSLQFRAFRGEL